jgi:hypothetical protein
MAKIRFGEVVADARGHIDGIVYTRNRYGAYASNRVAPVNPNTVRQQTIRENFVSLTTGWRDLTESQRTAWALLGSQMIRTDSLGNDYTLTGQQAYMSVNGVRLNQQQSVVDDAPILDTIPAITSASIVVTASGNAFTLTWTGTGFGASNGFDVWATPPLSAGKSFFRPSDYRWILFDDNPSSPINMLAAYEAKYGTLVAGDVGAKVSVLLVPRSGNFIQGTSFRADDIIEAGA